MVNPGLYCDLKRTPKASTTFSKKVHRYGLPFLTNHGLQGLQGHQTFMAGSLDLYPKNASYGIVQRVQTWVTWRPNGPGPVLPDLLHTSLGGLGLVSGTW